MHGDDKPLGGGDPDTQGTPTTNPDGWTLVLDEQFNNLDAWTVLDNVVAHVTTIQAENVSLIGGGGLRITVDSQPGAITGGEVKSIAKYGYGYFECRCKVPAGGGMQPAFWVSDRDHASPRPEIDIFEIYGDGNVYVGNWLGGNHERVTVLDLNCEGEYHIFAARWSSERVDFYVDDQKIAFITLYVPQEEQMNILLDNIYLVDMGTTTADFDIDYVKVWQVAA